MATLTFNDFIVGPNVTDIKKHYPSSRKTITADFAADVTSWTFEADYQCIVVDKIAFDRAGDPNFSESTVIGTFPKVEITGGDAPSVTDAANGTVEYYIPADMYTGALNAGSREKAVIAVLGFTYTDADGNTDTTRYTRLISYEPDVAYGDPTAEGDYTAL